MLSTRWFRRSPGRKLGPSWGARPCLECLEDRTAPAAIPPQPTTLVINPIGPSVFSFTNQKETVTVKATLASTGAPVGSGLVTIADGGQVQTVPVNAQGVATATFTFGLLQGNELPNPHTVNASYTDPNSVFGSSSAPSILAPNNSAGFNSQLGFDLVLLLALGL